MTFKRILFYWIASFILATIVYYLLWLILPNNAVFGSLYRMFSYHKAFPMQYIAIPCFFYGILATLFANNFRNKKTLGQILITVLIVVLTVLISSPFGGMLYFFHDMKAGFFVDEWVSVLFEKGFDAGLKLGWVIFLLSVPYNIIGIIICFFLTKRGASYLRNK